jgi:hypothetical protein
MFLKFGRFKMFEVEIDAFKKQFAKIGQGLSFADMGDEGLLNEQANNVAERFMTLHLAIMKHTLNGMDLALDQIATCFTVTKTMYFYQKEIVDNLDFWIEEDAINGLLSNNNRQMSFADMKFIEAVIKSIIIPLKDSHRDEAPSDLNRLELVNHYIRLVPRIDEENAVIFDLEERAQAGLELFPIDQKPKIEEGSTPEKTLKAIHWKSAINAEMALEQNLKAAQYLMAGIQLVQSRGCPEGIEFTKNETLGYLQHRLGLVMERFEILQDVADNRHGFTQLRFQA